MSPHHKSIRHQGLLSGINALGSDAIAEESTNRDMSEMDEPETALPTALERAREARILGRLSGHLFAMPAPGTSIGRHNVLAEIER